MTTREKLLKLTIGLNRAELARRAEVKPTVLNNYINRGSEPMAGAIFRIAKALDTPLEWLLDDNEDWPPPKKKARGELSVSAATDDEIMVEFARRYRRDAVALLDNLDRAAKIDWKKITQALERLKPDADTSGSFEEAERLARAIERQAFSTQGFGLGPGLAVLAQVDPHPRFEVEDLTQHSLFKRFVAVENQLHDFLRAIERRKGRGKQA